MLTLKPPARAGFKRCIDLRLHEVLRLYPTSDARSHGSWPQILYTAAGCVSADLQFRSDKLTYDH